MMKYVTPSAEIFGMSCDDVQTGLLDFFRASASGNAHLDTINFLDSFRVGKSDSGNAGSDRVNFGDLQ